MICLSESPVRATLAQPDVALTVRAIPADEVATATRDGRERGVQLGAEPLDQSSEHRCLPASVTGTQHNRGQAIRARISLPPGGGVQ